MNSFLFPLMFEEVQIKKSSSQAQEGSNLTLYLLGEHRHMQPVFLAKEQSSLQEARPALPWQDGMANNTFLVSLMGAETAASPTKEVKPQQPCSAPAVSAAPKGLLPLQCCQLLSCHPLSSEIPSSCSHYPTQDICFFLFASRSLQRKAWRTQHHPCAAG